MGASEVGAVAVVSGTHWFAVASNQPRCATGWWRAIRPHPTPVRTTGGLPGGPPAGPVCGGLDEEPAVITIGQGRVQQIASQSRRGGVQRDVRHRKRYVVGKVVGDPMDDDRVGRSDLDVEAGGDAFCVSRV